jgi:predicted RNA methylase
MKKSTGLKRETIDKYYTADNIVKKCMELIKTNISITKNDLCIEPSAGNGAFIEAIKSLFMNYKFYDLEPENSAIIKQDYLTFAYDTLIKTNYNKKHVIGNPPFGRQSSLAIQFIKKSIEYCDSISFILPKSFKKDSLKKHFPLNFHLVCEYDLPENSFMVDNKRYDVPCVFQIWVKKDTHRSIPDKLVPKKYKFVKKEMEHDISFRRVGVYAGEIDRNTDEKSFQSHYFIKFDKNVLTEKLYKKISEIHYSSKDYTVGPKSISKQELIEELNKLFI